MSSFSYIFIISLGFERIRMIYILGKVIFHFLKKTVTPFYASDKMTTKYLKNTFNSAVWFPRVSKPPQTLDELGQSLELWDTLNNDLPTTEAKFPPLNDQFAILEKYEVAIPEEVGQLISFLFSHYCIALVDISLHTSKILFVKHLPDYKINLSQTFTDG